MKKLLSIFFLLTTFYFILSTVSRADFDTAYNDYVYQQGIYRTSLTSYLTAKNRYLTYKTLTSQTEALSATKTFLQDRNLLIKSYLKVLLEKNTDTEIAKLLQNDILFYDANYALIPALANLEDCAETSNNVKEHYPQTEAAARQTIANILISKLKSVYETQTNIANELEKIVNSLLGSGKDIAKLQRWTLDFKNKQLLASGKIDEALILSSSLTPESSEELTNDFSKIQGLILNASQYLKEATANLEEIKEELKYGNY